MIATKALSRTLFPRNAGADVAKKSDSTRPVRLHNDVADLADMLAAIHRESVPDFLSRILRPTLTGMKKEAAAMLLEEKPATKKKP